MSVGSLLREAVPRVIGTLSSSHSDPHRPLDSSSATSVKVNCPLMGISNSWIRTRHIKEITEPAFMSPTPRPRIRPSRHSPEYGSNDQASESPAGN